jgi:translation initiation factor RLI1
MAPSSRETSSKETRIAIVNADKCRPKKCRLECKKGCPVVRMGELLARVRERGERRVEANGREADRAAAV